MLFRLMSLEGIHSVYMSAYRSAGYPTKNYSPCKALSTRITNNLRLILDRLPKYSLVFRQFTFHH